MHFHFQKQYYVFSGIKIDACTLIIYKQGHHLYIITVKREIFSSGFTFVIFVTEWEPHESLDSQKVPYSGEISWH